MKGKMYHITDNNNKHFEFMYHINNNKDKILNL